MYYPMPIQMIGKSVSANGDTNKRKNCVTLRWYAFSEKLYHLMAIQIIGQCTTHRWYKKLEQFYHPAVIYISRKIISPNSDTNNRKPCATHRSYQKFGKLYHPTVMHILAIQIIWKHILPNGGTDYLKDLYHPTVIQIIGKIVSLIGDTRSQRIVSPNGDVNNRQLVSPSVDSRIPKNCITQWRYK